MAGFPVIALVVASLAAPVSAHAVDVTDGLVLGYSFDRIEGDQVFDSSASGLKGIRIGSPVLPVQAASRPGFGQALEFDFQQKQFIYVADANPLDVNRFTLSAWVRYLPNVHDLRWEVLEKAGAYWMNIRTDSRKVRVGAFLGGCDGTPGSQWIYFDSASAIPDKTWTHLAATYDGTMFRIYINGTLDRSMPATGDTCSNSDVLAIGAKYKPSRDIREAFFDGRLEDLRIYKRALSATEINSVKGSSLIVGP